MNQLIESTEIFVKQRLDTASGDGHDCEHTFRVVRHALELCEKIPQANRQIVHLAALLHKGIAQDPTVLGADDILDMATVNAARAMGRTDSGLIEVGKCADLCVVDLDRPHLTPALDIPNLLVYSAQASDVIMTVIDGVILYDRGEFTSIYAEKAKYEFLSAVRRIGISLP